MNPAASPRHTSWQTRRSSADAPPLAERERCSPLSRWRAVVAVLRLVLASSLLLHGDMPATKKPGRNASSTDDGPERDTGKQYESDGRKVQDAAHVGGMSPDAEGDDLAAPVRDDAARRPSKSPGRAD
jgi:hypothetical protein